MSNVIFVFMWSVFSKSILYGLLLGCVLVLFGCRENGGMPKPMGYNRIDRPVYGYRECELADFVFEYADIAKVSEVKVSGDSGNWFNIVYPDYDAVIYCTFLSIDRESFGKVLEDSYHLAYSHSVMADAIEQHVYSDSVRGVGGVLYELGGNVATPVQFFITDSTTHFLRGSLYYSKDFDLDSVATITDFIRDDVVHLFKSVRFGDENFR